MELLFERSAQKIRQVPTAFIRSMIDTINWDARLTGIRGARGVGKTTLLLQYMKTILPRDHRSIYLTLDNIRFSEYRLYDFTDLFVKKGGRYLFLDEVHKYPDWSREIKNIYDDFPDLKIVFTGSSLLEILNARADLSRRAIVYEMQGFSFREYLNKLHGLNLSIVSLDDIISNHISLSESILSQVKVLEYFSDYLEFGYYPFYDELPGLYHQRIEEVINMILEVELPLLRGFEPVFVPKLKMLLQIIAESVPFVPNITKLSKRIGITRNTLLSYLYALEESHLTVHLHKPTFGFSKLQKPQKIYLENTNIMHALVPELINKGTIRETFFANQLKALHETEYTDRGDFLVNKQMIFEIGGRQKGYKQIQDIPDSYIVADDLEYGYGNKIPLWLFGFLY